MTYSINDLGLEITLLERLNNQYLPYALELQDKVKSGELLDHWDIQFLSDLCQGAEQIKPFIDKHPDQQELFSQVVHLYKQITDLALENENNL